MHQHAPIDLGDLGVGLIEPERHGPALRGTDLGPDGRRGSHRAAGYGPSPTG